MSRRDRQAEHLRMLGRYRELAELESATGRPDGSTPAPPRRRTPHSVGDHHAGQRARRKRHTSAP